MYLKLYSNYFQIILMILLFGTDSYVGDYEYDYGPGQAGFDFRRAEDFSESIFPRARAIKGKVTGMAKTESNLMDDLLNPNLSTKEADQRVPIPERDRIQPRSSGACPDSKCFRCLDSCRHLKKSRVAGNSLIQYTYLRLCSMGCKEELECLSNNYCLPVMEENPDYFVQCSSKCNLFLIVPKIFKTGQSC